MKIKLYSNLKDNLHCFQACLKMVLDYFGDNYSFRQLDKITGFRKGKMTWPTKGLLYLSKNGYEVIDICNFNFKRFAREGERYLKWYYSPDAYKYQKEHSDFVYEQMLVKKALKSKIKLINRKKIDIKKEAKRHQDCVIIAQVNNCILNQEKGYDSHSVVITNITPNYIFFNDPGLPAEKTRVSLKLFNKALNDEIILIKKLSMPKITIKQNIRKDAWNWWDACNRVSYGVNWKQRISKAFRNNIVGKTQKQALSFLIPYLKVLYKKKKINQRKREAQEIFHQYQDEIFSRMKKVTGKNIYKENFTCLLTTFPRAAYDYDRGYIWLPIVWPKETCVRTFVHELLHFQTYAYWKKQSLKKLTEQEFENLKEALTAILNEEFLDLISWRDKGYKVHQNLREKLLKFWRKNKDFAKLIEYGIKTYAKFSPS